MFQTNHLYLDQVVKAHQAQVQQEVRSARLEPLFAKLFRWLKHLYLPRPQAQMHHPKPT